MPPELSHIDCWIFDLDNTLYPASCNLFELIDERMGQYLQAMFQCDAAEARRIQKGYFRDHGTTLAGLMAEHGTDPQEFLDFVHDIDLARVTPNAQLNWALGRLPGRRLVFTNGDVAYAARVIDALGLTGCFDAVHDIHAADYVPKPAPSAYAEMCEAHRVDPHHALFAEDMVRNLKPAKSLGMKTLWVNNGSEQAGGAPCPSFVDHETHCVTHWLTELLEHRPA